MSAVQAPREDRAPETVGRPRGGRNLTVLLGHILGLQARSVAIWGVVFGAFGVMMASIFPAMGDVAQLEEYIQSFPEGLMQAAGVEDMASMTTIEGFLDAEIFGLVAPLALPFFAILAAAGAIAGAEENGTIDVLMGNPLPRWQLVAAYFVGIAISLAGILAIFGAFLWGSARLFDLDLSLETAVEGVFGLWPLGIFFGGLALLLSALFHRRALVVGISGVVLLGMYVLDALGGIVEEFEGIRNLSVIYHYGSPITDGIDQASFAGVCAVAVVLVALAMLAFRRRDIYT